MVTARCEMLFRIKKTVDSLKDDGIVDAAIERWGIVDRRLAVYFFRNVESRFAAVRICLVSLLPGRPSLILGQGQ